MTDWTRLESATRDLDPPFAVVDLAAFDANAVDLARRSVGLPIRLATKSVRCRALIQRALERPGFSGLMAYSLREALWLVRESAASDVLVAYPSADRAAWRDLAADPAGRRAVTVMVDGTGQLDLVEATLGEAARGLRLCLDVDASLRVGRAHLGVRRSPVRTPEQAVALAREIQRRGLRLVGVMMYDAQIAGLPDSSAAVRLVKSRSTAELLDRRAAVVAALREVAPLELVNGGGTGSLHVTGRDPVVTELAAGSGLLAPTLFDGYRDFHPEPAAVFALPVVRRPAADVVTVYGGGYPASGAAGSSRLPTPVWPPGLRLLRAEGAGEVQTPVKGDAARALAVGDRVWFRHAKAGELCERFDRLHLLDPGADQVGGDETALAVPTYRGEGRNFG